MRLSLSPSDLKPEFQTTIEQGGREHITIARSVHDITFEMLNEEAQAAIWAVGEALLFNRWKTEVVKIYPLSKKP